MHNGRNGNCACRLYSNQPLCKRISTLQRILGKNCYSDRIRKTPLRIGCNYPHRYLNGKLCLETDTSIRVRFVDGFSLEAWLEEFVEPYYFSYEFYQRYGEFPFGERGHDWKGIIQTYSDYFNEPDVVKTIRLMAFISDKKYRGHILCPCGSGRRLRSCHGPFIMKYCVDNRLRKIVRDDYLLLQEMVRKNDKQQ